MVLVVFQKNIEASGTPFGRYRARTLMNLADVSVRRKKKFKATTDSKHNLPIAPNLLDRNFLDVVWIYSIEKLWVGP